MTATQTISPESSTPIGPNGMMRTRQRPLTRLYKQEPAAAWIQDGACTVEGHLHRNDPVHGELLIGTSQPIEAPLSIHSAVGGDHDGPNPGDYLSAALVGCVDSTLRIIANRLGIVLEDLSVRAKAELDVRGTLCVSPDVPVGFQRITLSVDARPAEGTPPEAMQALLAATEHCCVVLQTLRNGVQVDVAHGHAQSRSQGEG